MKIIPQKLEGWGDAIVSTVFTDPPALQTDRRVGDSI